MKILFVNRMAAMVRGGGETFDLQIAAELQRMGHDVEFLSGRPLVGREKYEVISVKEKTNQASSSKSSTKQPASSNQHPAPSIKHQASSIKFHLLRSPYFGWFPWDKVRGGWRLRLLEFRLFEWLAVRWISRHSDAYDVIQICELPYVVAGLKNRKFKKPLVMRLTGPNYDESFDGVCLADGIIASGTTIATVMKTRRPDAVNVPNCVDSNRFKPQNSVFRKQYGIAEDDLVLLYVARFQDFKDHETLIRSIGEIVKKNPDTRLVLAGSGHTRSTVDALIDDLGLGNHVLILGETDYELLPKIYAAADIMMISSVYESFCFAALEAMATGLPIVTADNGWVPQLLGRGEMPAEALLPGYEEADDAVQEFAGGLVVPKKTPECMAEAVLRLAGDPEKRAVMGRRNREEVVEKYNWKKSAVILEKLYKNLTTTKDAELHERGERL